MSRPLVVAAALAFAAVGLLPLAALAAALDPSDLASILDARTTALLLRTVLYGLSVAALALVLGLPFGFLVARTDLPLARALRPLGLVPMLIPPMLLAMVWTVLLDARGAPAAVLVSALSTFPLVALFAARAFERIDARAEEAALLAGGLGAALRADLPLVLPPALCGACLAFVFTIHDFSVPDYVSWVGPRFNVFADEIFASWRASQDVAGGLGTSRATALSLPLVVLTLASLLPALALRRRGAMASLSPAFRRPDPLRLGAWRWPALAFALALLAAGAAVPIGRLVYEAGGGSRGFAPSKLAPAFARALETARGDLRNSLVYAAAAATLCAVLALVLGHALERSRRGRLFEPLAVLPLAVPAILFGIGAIAAFNRPSLAGFYDGGGVVVALYAGRFAAFALLVSAGAAAMLDPRLEEAAQVAGAGPARRLASVVAPCLRSAVLGGWVLVFVFCLRELDAAILVPAANHTAVHRVFNAVHFGRDAFVAALSLIVVFLILLPGILWSLFARSRLELLP